MELNSEKFWWESIQFTFFRIPKAFFDDEQYRQLSLAAKLLYSLMLDRMSLSSENGWLDENGCVYIFYTISEICKKLYCGHDKATRTLRELEKAALITRINQGQGKPARLYILPFSSGCDYSSVRKSEKQMSGVRNLRSLECVEPAANNTDNNHTEISYNYLSIGGFDIEKMEAQVKENIDYEILTEKGYGESLDEIVRLMGDVICGTSPTVRIGGDEFTREAVRSRLLKLNSEHIEYVLDCMKKNKSAVRNIRAYMLTALYNAPVTMDHYYQSMFNADLP